MPEYWLSMCDSESFGYEGEHDPEDRRVEIRSQILAWYEAGKPLFTRESIASLQEQVQSSQPGQLVSLPDLDDNIVQWKVRPGEVVWRASDSPEELVLFSPMFKYCSIQELLDIEEMLHPRFAYCPLRLWHWSQTRNTVTQEFPPRAPLASETEVGMLFDSTRRAWEASKECAQFRLLIESQHVLRGLSKVIAFACGSIAERAKPSPEDATYPLYQHSLILTLQDTFAKMTKTTEAAKIPCYAQDPSYDPPDIAVLERAGITILDDPQGFIDVDHSTAVISVAPDIPVRQIVMDLTLPLLMIWDRHNEIGYDARRTDPGSPRMERIFAEHYNVFDFPGTLESFEGLAIYVRKSTFPTIKGGIGHLPTLDPRHIPRQFRPPPEFGDD